MNKKCINCKHLIKGRCYAYCELVIPRARIEKKQLYQFAKCTMFREKDFTGIPDSLWELGRTETKIKKKIKDLTQEELHRFCNRHKDCSDCDLWLAGSSLCYKDIARLEKKEEL